METVPKEVVYYSTKEGKLPFRDWFFGLRDADARARITVRLNRLALGLMGDWKSVQEGVYELRVDYGPGYRVYFGQDGPKVVLLLCGGDKRTQDRDIRSAKKYWQDYLGRKDKRK
jgi:putative addiction module killer protein